MISHEEKSSSTRSLEWIDVENQKWDVHLSPEKILFRSGNDEINLKEERWSKDLYAAKHGEGYIVRVETFECAIQFILDANVAAPFFQHVNPPAPVAKPSSNEESEPQVDKPLLWPKISPLAVWALICSVLTFIPVIGWVAAAVSITLTVLHRKRVRVADAWRHSRLICRYANVFTFGGIAISVLATWTMMQSKVAHAYVSAAGAAEAGANYGLIAGAIFVVLLSLTVHEAAHAVTAWWLGDRLAHSQGRVTLNPLAHIDPFGTILLPVMLAVFKLPIFGYARPVEVRVEALPRYRRAHILISLAGPGSNLMLAALSLALLILIGCIIRLAYPEAGLTNLSAFTFGSSVSAYGFPLAAAAGSLCTILQLSFAVNLLLAMFNLIPIPPLDGSWVLEHLFPTQLGRFYAMLRPYGFLVFLFAIYSGVFRYLMYPVKFVLNPGFELVYATTGF